MKKIWQYCYLHRREINHDIDHFSPLSRKEMLKCSLLHCWYMNWVEVPLTSSHNSWALHSVLTADLIQCC